jgi:hypothetical protein
VVGLVRGASDLSEACSQRQLPQSLSFGSLCVIEPGVTHAAENQSPLDKDGFGACTFSKTSPVELAPSTRCINVVITFEEALKLNLALMNVSGGLTRTTAPSPKESVLRSP